MRSKHYQQKIKEDPETLLAKEKLISISRLKDRVRLLRLLKAGIVPNLKTAAEAVGISERQATRVWNLYKEKGLSGLLELKYSGKKSKLDKDKEQLLIERLATKGFENLQEAKQFIEQNFGKSYTLPGVWTLMKRLKEQALDVTIPPLPTVNILPKSLQAKNTVTEEKPKKKKKKDKAKRKKKKEEQGLKKDKKKSGKKDKVKKKKKLE